MFTQPVSMKVTEEQGHKLALLLEKLDYNFYNHVGNDASKWVRGFNCIVTNYAKQGIDKIGFSINCYKDRFHIEEYNEELFLALAAMTDEEYGIAGEWWTCIKENKAGFVVNNLYKSVKSVDQYYSLINDLGKETGFQGNNLDFFRKATREELVNHFTQQIEPVRKEKPMKQIKPLETFGGRDVIHCPTQAEFTAIINKLNDMRPTHQFNNDFHLVWDRYKENTCFHPNDMVYANLMYYNGKNYAVHSVGDYLDPELPKAGDPVPVDIENNPMPKFQSGQIVELEGGRRGLVVDISGDLRIYWLNKASGEFHSGMLPKEFKTNKLARKIYSLDTGSIGGISVNIYTDKAKNLIWEYKDPTVEISLEEIAAKFNVKVENLRIKDYE